MHCPSLPPHSSPHPPHFPPISLRYKTIVLTVVGVVQLVPCFLAASVAVAMKFASYRIQSAQRDTVQGVRAPHGLSPSTTSPQKAKMLDVGVLKGA